MVVSGIRHNLHGTYIERRKCWFRSGLGATDLWILAAVSQPTAARE